MDIFFKLFNEHAALKKVFFIKVVLQHLPFWKTETCDFIFTFFIQKVTLATTHLSSFLNDSLHRWIIQKLKREESFDCHHVQALSFSQSDHSVKLSFLLFDSCTMSLRNNFTPTHKKTNMSFVLPVKHTCV